MIAADLASRLRSYAELIREDAKADIEDFATIYRLMDMAADALDRSLSPSQDSSEVLRREYEQAAADAQSMASEAIKAMVQACTSEVRSLNDTIAELRADLAHQQEQNTKLASDLRGMVLTDERVRRCWDEDISKRNDVQKKLRLAESDLVEQKDNRNRDLTTLKHVLAEKKEAEADLLRLRSALKTMSADWQKHPDDRTSSCGDELAALLCDGSE